MTVSGSKHGELAGERFFRSEQPLALDAALVAAYRDHDALCHAHPVARGHVSRPPIPSAFSESLTALLLGSLCGVGATVAYGGAGGGLLAFSPGGRAVTVEVEASSSPSDEAKEALLRRPKPVCSAQRR